MPCYVHFSFKGLKRIGFYFKTNLTPTHKRNLKFHTTAVRYWLGLITFPYDGRVSGIVLPERVITSSSPYFLRRACCPPRFNFIAMPAHCQSCTG